MEVKQIIIYKLPVYARPTFETTTTTSIFFKGKKGHSKTIGLVTLKSTKGKLSSEIVTEVIVCLADLDKCHVPVVAQLVKEQVGYDIILLNNKLYPILDGPSTRGDFWQSTSRKILAASAELYEKKIQARGQVLRVLK